MNAERAAPNSTQRDDPSGPDALYELSHADSVGLADRQRRVLELLASGAKLPEVLTATTMALEELIPGSRCSVLLLNADGDTLRHGAAPSLPSEYSEAIDGMRIAPDAGSCGAAAYLGTPVVTTDIASDPRWQRFRDRALPHGLRACWSSPIFGRQGGPVGTFAVYHTSPHRPTRREERLVDRFTHLASVAIDHAALFGALTQSEERFRRAFEDNAVGMAVTDLDGRLLRVNAALTGMVGRAEPELLHSDLAAHVLDEDVAEWRAALRRLGAGDETSVRFDARLTRPEGPTAVVAVTASAIRDVAGSPERLSLNLLDITQHRAAQAERRARREAEVGRGAAEAANQAKSQFLSEFSHELRTPLQAITGFTELLETPELPAQRRTAALRHISEASDHILALVEDALDIAKIEAGALSLHPEQVPVATLAHEVTDLMEPLAAKRGVSLLGGELSGRVRADPRRARQILINLVSNAVRYNYADGWVRVGACRRSDQPAEVAIEVTDSGPGISEEQAQRLFTPFDRLGAETSQEPGSGLGLALSQSLAQAMGGHLEADTAAGVGACVRLTLPAA